MLLGGLRLGWQLQLQQMGWASWSGLGWAVIEKTKGLACSWAGSLAARLARFFYVFIFYFRFIQKYIFVRNLHEYTPAAPGRPAVGWQGLI